MKIDAYPSGAKVYHIPYFEDDRGALNVLEIAKEMPFECKRVFWTYTIPRGSVRGEHAHILCEEFLVSVSGIVTVKVDNGVNQDEIVLDSPSKGIHLPAGCWTEQYGHSEDSVLLVLASRPYEDEDYIRTYDEFLRWKARGSEK